jgi:hypothetical protein
VIEVSSTHPPSESRRRRSELLAALYPVPNPLRSDEERVRFSQEDLAGKTRGELQLERRKVAWVLAFADAPHPWLLSRLDAIDRRLRDGT